MSHDIEPMDVDEFGEYSPVLKESAKTPKKLQYYNDFDNKENSYNVNITDDRFKIAADNETFDAFDDSCTNMKLRWSCTPGSSPAINRSAYDSPDRSINNSLVDKSNSTFTAVDFENGNAILSSYNYSSDDQGMATSLDNSRITILEHTSTNLSLDSCKSDTLVQDRSIETNKVPNISFNSVEEVKQDIKSQLTIDIGNDKQSNSKDSQGASSPILRGIKSVINMFRPSQSPIAPCGTSLNCAKNLNKATEKPSPTVNKSNEKIMVTPDKKVERKNSVSNRTFEGETKKQDSSEFVTVFKEDFINDIKWNDDSTIIFNTKKPKGNQSLQDGDSHSILSSSGMSSEFQSIQSRGSSLSKMSLNETCDNIDQPLTNEICLKSPAKLIPEETQNEIKGSIQNDSAKKNNLVESTIEDTAVDKNSGTIYMEMIKENKLMENRSNRESNVDTTQIMPVAVAALTTHVLKETLLHCENNVQGNVSKDSSESSTNMKVLDASNLSQLPSPLDCIIDKTAPNNYVSKEVPGIQNVNESKRDSQVSENKASTPKIVSQENASIISEDNFKSSEMITIDQRDASHQKSLIREENYSPIEEFEDCLEQLSEANGFELSFETISASVSESLPAQSAEKCNDILLQTIVRDPQMPVIPKNLENSNVIIEVEESKLLTTITCNSENTETKKGRLNLPHNGLDKKGIIKIDQVTDNTCNKNRNISQNEEFHSKVGEEKNRNNTDVNIFPEITAKETATDFNIEIFTEKLDMNLNASNVLETDNNASHTNNTAVSNKTSIDLIKLKQDILNTKIKIDIETEPRNENNKSTLADKSEVSTIPPTDEFTSMIESIAGRLNLIHLANDNIDHTMKSKESTFSTECPSIEDTFQMKSSVGSQENIQLITKTENRSSVESKQSDNFTLEQYISVEVENNDIGLTSTNLNTDIETHLASNETVTLGTKIDIAKDKSVIDFNSENLVARNGDQEIKISNMNETEISYSKLSNKQSINTLLVETDTNLSENISYSINNEAVLSNSQLDGTIELNKKPGNEFANGDMSLQIVPNISYFKEKSVDGNIESQCSQNDNFENIANPSATITNITISPQPESVNCENDLESLGNVGMPAKIDSNISYLKENSVDGNIDSSYSQNDDFENIANSSATKTNITISPQPETGNCDNEFESLVNDSIPVQIDPNISYFKEKSVDGNIESQCSQNDNFENIANPSATITNITISPQPETGNCDNEFESLVNDSIPVQIDPNISYFKEKSVDGNIESHCSQNDNFENIANSSATKTNITISPQPETGNCDNEFESLVNDSIPVQIDPNISYFKDKSVDGNIESHCSQNDNFENIANPSATITNITISPQPESGNCENDFGSTIDPFKTNTKIRLSPDPELHHLNIPLDEIETGKQTPISKTISGTKMDLSNNKKGIDEDIPDKLVFGNNITDTVSESHNQQEPQCDVPSMDVTIELSTDCRDVSNYSQNATTLSVSLDTVTSDLTGEMQSNKLYTSEIQECDEPVIFQPIKASTSNDLGTEMNFDASLLMKANNNVIDEPEDIEINEVMQSEGFYTEENENPFFTRTKVRMSPNIEEKSSVCKELYVDTIEKSFASQPKVRVSPSFEQPKPLIRDTDKNGDLIEVTMPIEENKLMKDETYVADQVSANTTSNKSITKQSKNTPNKQKRPLIRKSQGSKILSATTPKKIATPIVNMKNEENVDFESIKNPFATRTSIRMSPTLTEMQNKCIENLQKTNKILIGTTTQLDNTYSSEMEQSVNQTSEHISDVSITVESPSKNNTPLKIIPTKQKRSPLRLADRNSNIHEDNNPLVTRSTVRLSPSLENQQNHNISAESIINGASQTFGSNIDVKSISNVLNETVNLNKTNETNTIDSNDIDISNPFATRSKVRLSPSLENQHIHNITIESKSTAVCKLASDIDVKRISIVLNETVNLNENNETKTMDNNDIDISNPFATRFKVRLSPSLENQQIHKFKAESEKISVSEKHNSDFALTKCSNDLNQTVTLNKMNETKTIESNDIDSSNPFATKSKIRASPPLDVTITNFDKDNMHSTIENGETTYIKKSDSVLEISQVINKNEPINTTVSKPEDKKDSCLNLTADQTFDKSSNETILNTAQENESSKSSFGYIQQLVNQVSNIILPSQKLLTTLNGSSEQNAQEQLASDDVTMKQDEDDDKFAPAEMFFKDEAIDYLMNQTTATTDRGKDSLFIKFDPLYVANGRSNLEKIDAASTSGNAPARNRMSGSFHEKPVLAVSPAVNSDQIKHIIQTPPRQEGSTLQFVSPAIAAIDKLISLGGSPARGSPPAMLVDIRDTSSVNYFQQQMEAANRLLSEREEEYKKKISDLEKSNIECAANVKVLEVKLLEQSKQNTRMIKLNEEYEQTILSLLSKRDDEKKKQDEEFSRLVRERDEQTAHLSSMEHSFNDLHAKYEKCKSMILSFKSNEEVLKKRITDSEANCKKLEEAYEQIKKHATTKLNEANQTLETMKKAHKVETVKLNALIRRKELEISSIQETLMQKIKDNQALESICDELLNKVG